MFNRVLTTSLETISNLEMSNFKIFAWHIKNILKYLHCAPCTVAWNMFAFECLKYIFFISRLLGQNLIFSQNIYFFLEKN